MTRYAQRSLRPLICASVLLLALSIVAPWLWRAVSLGPTPAPQSLAGRQIPFPPPVRSILLRPEPEQSPEAIVVAVPQINWEPEPRDVAEGPRVPLGQFDVSPLLAEIVPPVTELIELDPSLSETPQVPPTRSPARRTDDPAVELPDLPLPGDLDAPLPPPVERTPPILTPRTGGVWPYPASLIHQLRALAEESPAAGPWASRAITELEALSVADSLASDEVAAALKNLTSLAEEVRQHSAPQPPSRDRTLRLRAGYAIMRRLAIWETVAEMTAKEVDPQSSSPFVPAQLARQLREIDQLLDQAPAAQAWRSYLRIDELRELAGLDGPPTASHRALARDVLARLDSPRLDQRQQQFITASPLGRLVETLRPAAQDSIEWASLLDAVEQREAIDSSLNTQRVAELYQILRWSSEEHFAALAGALNDNYRNANVRVAISEELINRFVPGPQVMAEHVVDNIRGADVVGRSESLTRLRIVLLPDRLRWRLGLEARGAVASETESSKGPARFWNDGRGEFNARKQVTVDRRGLAVHSAQTQASAHSYLKDFETDFDAIPLFNVLARSVARQQYEDEQPAARFEIEERISTRASLRLDYEVDQRIAQAEREFQQKLIAPLERLNLEPTPVDMETTSRRLIVRYRLAGPHQLSAHTPRPQAPGNSLLSLQLHESVLNNSLENLKLADRRIDLRDLYVEMLKRFEAAKITIPDDLPEDVTVHFAEHDPVRITCEDGRVKLTIRLKELDHAGEHVWRNFEVRGYYRPSDNQLEANLVRDGNLELSGERLKLGDQVALRGIFANVLSRNRQLSIVNKQLLMRPQLADLQVTQFVIQDGWIGVAMGPKSDYMRPLPSSTTEASPEVTRRPLRNLFNAHR